jgi:hypothetical protein
MVERGFKHIDTAPRFEHGARECQQVALRLGYFISRHGACALGPR